MYIYNKLDNTGYMQKVYRCMNMIVCALSVRYFQINQTNIIVVYKDHPLPCTELRINNKLTVM